MSRFKLLALRTGRKLTEIEQSIPETRNYLKGLAENTLFYFLHTHEIIENGSCIKPRNIDTVDLYSDDNTTIEVSAIVGANGSGKSTLLEIIYLIINNISISKGILLEDRHRIDIPESFLFCDLYFQLGEDQFYRIQCEYLKTEDNRYNRERSSIYKGNYNDNQKYFEFVEATDISLFEFEQLFYTIVVNYSIHGLNDTYLGYWINYLFHKNDSYQTPIVINPMRTHGDFKINLENEFARYRLLSNSIVKAYKTKKPVFLTDDLFIDSVDFRLNAGKIEHLEHLDYDREVNGPRTRTIEELLIESDIDIELDIIIPLFEVFFPKEEIPSDVVFSEQVKKYLAKKLYKIAFTYKKYYNFLDLKSVSIPSMFIAVFDKSKLSDYFMELKDDNSHVTLKLRQTIHFLKFKPLRQEDCQPQKPVVFHVQFEAFEKRISEYGNSPMEYLPPGLFKTKINLKSKRTGEVLQMEKMSSGELQLINSVQSTLYHLNNLDSYYEFKDSEQSEQVSFKKIKYENALIIFDEVELYFHPEYQRKLVDYLLAEIKDLKLKLVKNIHLLLVTHSPFILSDLPTQNILMLEETSPKVWDSEKKTFGANIHDLLADKFFLKNSIGTFATDQINKIINLYNKVSSLNNIDHQAAKTDYNENKSKYDFIIKNIGDDVIREILSDQMEFIHDFFNEYEEN